MATSTVAIASSVNQNQARFVAGMIPDQRPRTIRTGIVKTAAGIGLGKAVSQHTTDDGVILTGTDAATFVGVTCEDQGSYALDGTDTVPENFPVAVLQSGAVVVQVSVAVTAGQPAYCVAATGLFTNVATDNINIDGVFETSAAQNGLAVLRLK